MIGALDEVSIDTIRGAAVCTAQSSLAPRPPPTRMIKVSVVTVPRRRSAAQPWSVRSVAQPRIAAPTQRDRDDAHHLLSRQ